DGLLQGAEIVAGGALRLDAERFPERVAADIGLRPEAFAIDAGLRIQIPELPAIEPPPAESLYYPKGTIRSLDDPIFSDHMASLGMYRPAAFMEVAPLMFYALEEDAGYKTPVIFVHGIGGSAANFAPIVDRMDRQRYAPW